MRMIIAALLVAFAAGTVAADACRDAALEARGLRVEAASVEQRVHHARLAISRARARVSRLESRGSRLRCRSVPEPRDRATCRSINFDILRARDDLRARGIERDALLARLARLQERGEALRARFRDGGACVRPSPPGVPMCAPEDTGLLVYRPAGPPPGSRVLDPHGDATSCIEACYAADDCRSVIQRESGGDCHLGGDPGGAEQATGDGPWIGYLICG